MKMFPMDHIRDVWRRGPVLRQESVHKGKNRFNNFLDPRDMILLSEVTSALSTYLSSSCYPYL